MSADIANRPAPSAIVRGLAFLQSLLEKFHEARRIRRDQRDARDAFLHLLHLDKKRLDDIGVTREEVDWAAKLPLEICASKALHERARKRRIGEY